MKKSTTESAGSTRENLIESAERLFAARGFDGVSVRDIANDAKVNSALVGYYFGGKQGLLTEVYTRHCAPLKNERERLLASYSADRRVPTLEEVLDAFIRPSLGGTPDDDGRPTFHFLLGSIYYTATGPQRIKILSKGKCNPADPAETTHELITFVAAGFRAPSAVGGAKAPAARKRVATKSSNKAKG